MELSPYEIALIGGGFTIVGALVGAWIGYRSAIKIHTITEFNKAAAKFRAAFLPQIIYLTHNADIHSCGNLREVLDRSYLREHLQALETFKAHLCAIKRDRIQKAWDDYCYPKGPREAGDKERDHRFIDYDTMEDAHSVALEKINNILEFADYM